MLAGLGKGLLLRLGAYALFLWGFWMLYQAFERSSIPFGVGGGVAILAAMGAMVGFRRPPFMGSAARRDDDDSHRGSSSKP